MNNCSMCGAPIPDGQDVCSMCYGDIDYGSDGYYRHFMEENMRRQHEQEQWKERVQRENGKQYISSR